MSVLDRVNIEVLLDWLDENGGLFSRYCLCKDDGKLCMLGKGGFSVVCEMTDRYDNSGSNNGVRYALKIIGLEKYTTSSDDFRETTHLQSYMGIHTDNVVKVIDMRQIRVTFNDDGEPVRFEADTEADTAAIFEAPVQESFLLKFILMERCEEIVHKDKFNCIKLNRMELSDEGEVIRFAMQMCDCIMLMHQRNVMHRDIKLENIFWDDKDNVYKLSDFGMAKRAEYNDVETVVYTDGYGAPEIVCRLGESYDKRADIYSLGMAIYLLLNDLKFPGSDGYYVNRVQYNPDFIFPAPQNASSEFVRIIRKMCSYHKEERYQNIEDVLSDLAQISGTKASARRCTSLDMPTETYKDSVFENNDLSSYDNDSSMDAEGSFENDSIITLDRLSKREIERRYNWLCRRYLPKFTILLSLIIIGFQADLSIAANWSFYILPAMALIEAVLIRWEEFYIVFGAATFMACCYSMYITGITVPHIILLLSLVSGRGVCVASAALGNMVWMLLTLTHITDRLGFIREWDIAWILLVILVFVFDNFSCVILLLKPERRWKVVLYRAVFDYPYRLPLIVGMLLCIIEHLHILEIPEIITRLHPVRCGILILMIEIIRRIHTTYTEGDDTDYVRMDEQ